MRSMKRSTFYRGLSVVVAAATLIPALVTGPAHAAPTFAAAKRVGGGSEPEITIGPDGALVVDAPQGTPGHSALWRQDPGATSWKASSFPQPYNKFPGGGDSSVSFGPGATPGGPYRVYFLDLWLGSNSLTVSEDSGATWSSGTPVTTLPPSDRQWIGTGKRDPLTGKDTLYIVYRGVGAPQFTRSTDGGLTWTSHGFIPGVAPTTGGGSNPIYAEGDYIATNYVAGGGQVVIATSSDAGSTWTTSKPKYAKNANGFIQNLAVDGNDFWIAYQDNAYNIQVVHSPDRGVTWEREGFPTQMNDGGSNVFPWIAARNGHVGVSWYSAPTASGDPNVVNAPWYLMYSEFSGYDEFGNMTFTAPIKVGSAVKTGGICTMGIGCTKDRELGDYQTIVMDVNNKAIIAYNIGGSSYVVKQS